MQASWSGELDSENSVGRYLHHSRHWRGSGRYDSIKSYIVHIQVHLLSALTRILMYLTIGKSGPLFNFDVSEDLRLKSDASVEKTDSHAGK